MIVEGHENMCKMEAMIEVDSCRLSVLKRYHKSPQHVRMHSVGRQFVHRG
jgi:hypothetical protein